MNLITNDYLKGYRSALANVESMLETTLKDVESIHSQGMISQEECLHLQAAYKSVQDYVESVKENYKKLVKDANDGKLQ